MEGFLVFLTVFITLASSVCTAILAPLRQYRLRIDARLFKRVKVKFPAFLFVGIGGNKSKQGNVKDFGVIIPMFVLHLVGYFLALFIWAIVPTLYYRLGVDLDVLFVIPLGIAVLFGIAVFLTEFICVRLSRTKQFEEHTEKQPSKKQVEAAQREEQQANVELVVEQPEEQPNGEEQVEEQSVEQQSDEQIAEDIQPVTEQVTEDVQPETEQVDEEHREQEHIEENSDKE